MFINSVKKGNGYLVERIKLAEKKAELKDETDTKFIVISKTYSNEKKSMNHL